MATLRKMKWNMILVGLGEAALGVLMLLRPEQLLDAICYFVGGLVILGGLLQIMLYYVERKAGFLAKFTLVFGIICVLGGLVLMMNSRLVMSILPWLFGLLLLYDTVLHLIDAAELRSVGWPGWAKYLILALASAALGLVMVRYPFGSVAVLARFVGAVLAVEGVVHMVEAVFTARTIVVYAGMADSAALPGKEGERRKELSEESHFAPPPVVEVNFEEVDGETAPGSERTNEDMQEI